MPPTPYYTTYFLDYFTAGGAQPSWQSIYARNLSMRAQQLLIISETKAYLLYSFLHTKPHNNKVII